MFLTIIAGLGCMAAIGFLIFCYSGFSRTQKANRSRPKNVTVLALDRDNHMLHKSRRPLLAVLFFGIVPPTLMRAQVAGQTGSDANTKQAGTSAAQPAPPTAAVPAAPLPSPAMVGPLSTAVPKAFDAGPFGQLDVTGILSGFGYWQEHPASTDQAARADVSNGQIFLQKTTGLVQFYVQAGAYSLPSLGTPILSHAKHRLRLFRGFAGRISQVGAQGRFFLSDRQTAFVDRRGRYVYFREPEHRAWTPVEPGK